MSLPHTTGESRIQPVTAERGYRSVRVRMQACMHARRLACKLRMDSVSTTLDDDDDVEAELEEKHFALRVTASKTAATKAI